MRHPPRPRSHGERSATSFVSGCPRDPDRPRGGARRVVSLRNLPRERLSDCAARIRWQRIPRGTYLRRVGDPANAIFILALGAIRGSRVGPDGEEFVDMVVSGPGDLVG